MFSSPAERESVLRRVRTASDLEISTRIFLDDLSRNAQEIAKVKPEQRALHVSAAYAAIKRPNRDEQMNAAWKEMPLPARMVACMAGKLPKERGALGLESINAVERVAVNLALDDLIRQLQAIQKLMYGGPLPKASA